MNMQPFLHDGLAARYRLYGRKQAVSRFRATFGAKMITVCYSHNDGTSRGHLARSLGYALLYGVKM
jgi:hypothetical protein